MYEFKVLAVDDEPHVLESIDRTLREITEYRVEVYKASNATAALRLIGESRMDLVISDIEMPGMDGLTMTRTIREKWPQCKITLLTAFASFKYAYEAIAQNVDAYILKTESKASMLTKFRGIFEKIIAEWSEAGKNGAFQESLNSICRLPALEKALRAENAEEGEYLEFFADCAGEMCILLCSFTDAKPVNIDVLVMLLYFYLRDIVRPIAYSQTSARSVVFLFRIPGKHGCDERNHVFGQLESFQAACKAIFSRCCITVMKTFAAEKEKLQGIYAELLESEESLRLEGESVIYRLPDEKEATRKQGNIAERTVQWISEYAKAHIAEDLSLARLSRMTGYNSQYLSTIFHQQMGKSFSRYVADLKVELIREMLEEGKESIQEISNGLGFASPSYFSRFVRREIGKTPQQLRENQAAEKKRGEKRGKE